MVHLLHVKGRDRIAFPARALLLYAETVQVLVIDLSDLLCLHDNFLLHFLAQILLHFLRCKCSKFSDIHL